MILLDHEVTVSGEMRQEGGDLTACCPTLLGGDKVVLGCGAEVRVVDAASSRQVALLQRHQARVIGTATTEGRLLSCDETGVVAVGTLSACDVLKPFPMPASACVEHIAFVGWQNRYLALVVNMNRGVGPRCLLLQRDYLNYSRKKYKILASDVMQGPSVVAYNTAQSFSAVLTVVEAGRYALHVLPIRAKGNKDNETRNHRVLLGRRTPTCVCAHPSSDTVAVGDTMGGVQLYYKVLQSDNPSSVRLHWHHTPVAHACFSCTGSELYSGGAEGALVQWRVWGATSKERHVLPHLGQPLSWVLEGEGLVVAGHTDNSYSVVSSATMQTTNLILGLGSRQPDDTHTTKPILMFDPRTNALVTSARPGYLLFYDVASRSQLQHVDVVHENHVPGAEARTVQHVSLASDGRSLVTVDGARAADTRLRFWTFSDTTQSWVLACCVLRPHADAVLGVQTRPGPLEGAGPAAVLSWTAGEARLWHPCRGLDGALQYQSHCSKPLGGYELEPCVGVAWWHCGGMVATGSGRTVTVYDVSDDATRLNRRVSRRVAGSGVCQLLSTPHCLLVLSPCGLLTSLPLLLPLEPLTLPLQASSLHASPHLPSRVVVATKTNQILVVEPLKGAVLARLQCPGAPLALALCRHPSADPCDVMRVFAHTSSSSVVSADVAFTRLGSATLRLSEESASQHEEGAEGGQLPLSSEPLPSIAPSLQSDRLGNVINAFYSSNHHEEVRNFSNWLSNMDAFAIDNFCDGSE